MPRPFTILRRPSHFEQMRDENRRRIEEADRFLTWWFWFVGIAAFVLACGLGYVAWHFLARVW